MKKKRNLQGFVLILAILVMISGIVMFVVSRTRTHGDETADLYEAIKNKWNSIMDEEGDPEYLKLIDRQSSFSIVDVTEEDGMYTVLLDVLGPDVKSALQESDGDALLPENSPGDMDDFVLKQVKKAKKVHSQVEIYAEKTSSEANESAYDIVLSDSFIDAMSGLLYGYTLEQIDSALSGAVYEEG